MTSIKQLVLLNGKDWKIGQIIELLEDTPDITVESIHETNKITSYASPLCYVVKYSDGRKFEVPYHAVLFTQVK